MDIVMDSYVYHHNYYEYKYTGYVVVPLNLCSDINVQVVLCQVVCARYLMGFILECRTADSLASLMWFFHRCVLGGKY